MIVRSESRVLGEGELLLAAAVRETEERRAERMAPRREEVVTILACSLSVTTYHAKQTRTAQMREEKKVSGKE